MLICINIYITLPLRQSLGTSAWSAAQSIIPLWGQPPRTAVYAQLANICTIDWQCPAQKTKHNSIDYPMMTVCHDLGWSPHGVLRQFRSSLLPCKQSAHRPSNLKMLGGKNLRTHQSICPSAAFGLWQEQISWMLISFQPRLKKDASETVGIAVPDHIVLVQLHVDRTSLCGSCSMIWKTFNRTFNGYHICFIHFAKDVAQSSSCSPFVVSEMQPYEIATGKCCEITSIITTIIARIGWQMQL